jgi:signal transduction histidine kinase
MDNLNERIHDIRKPLNNISMQAELIKMIAEASADDPKLTASADKIIQNAKLCSEMLQALFEDMTSASALSNTSTKGE